MRHFRPSFRNCFAAARLVLFELATARSTSNASRPPSNSRGRCQRIGNRVEYRRRRADGAALADALGAGAARSGPCLQMMDFDARDFSCGRHGIVGVAGVEEPRVRRLTAEGSRVRTSGPSNQSSSAVLTPDAMAGHIRHVCFRRAPRINPARDSAIAPGQPHPQWKGRSAPGLKPGPADAHLDHRLGPALLPHAAR